MNGSLCAQCFRYFNKVALYIFAKTTDYVCNLRDLLIADSNNVFHQALHNGFTGNR